MVVQSTVDQSLPQEFSFRGRIVTGLLSSILLVGALGGWAATSELSGAVIAHGTMKVDKDLRAIQHLDGGIIKRIEVKRGDVVQLGQLLFKLDDTQTRAELQIVKSQLIELLAKRSRLLAERDGLAQMVRIEGFDDLDIENAPVTAGERRLFEGNRANRESQRKQLQASLRQLDEEINGLLAQQGATEKELTLVKQESSKVGKLMKQRLVDGTRGYNTDRDLTRLLGNQGEVAANIARSRAKINEIELQLLAIDDSARTAAQKDLSEIDPKIGELRERRMAIEDRLSRTEVRAPVSGTVNEVAINTLGGVITPAQKVMTIVPADAKLQVEIHISPADIDQVVVGQAARLRFSAFNQRDTKELKGEVSFVSPATTTDANSGQSFYVANVTVSDDEMSQLGSRRLVPGMPVEAFVSTEARTALSYLVKPFTDQLSRAFREE